MSTNRWPSTALHWLLLAAALHVTLTIVVLLAGRFELLPKYFDANGIGIGFSLDSLTYRNLASDLADVLKHNGIAEWLRTSTPLHLRLYSLSFTIFGGLFGNNVLAAEPLNLVYFIGTLILIYFIGKEIFSERAGLIAAIVVAVWPSFLIHSTQLIRDPLSNSCLLTLFFLMTIVLQRDLSTRSSLIVSLCGAITVTVFWMTRGNMWNIVLLILTLTTIFLIVRTVRARRIPVGNLLALIIVFGTVLFVPSRIESTTLPGQRSPRAAIAIPSSTEATSLSIWGRFMGQLINRRAAFQRSYIATGSSLDPDVTLRTSTDVLSYLPRATEIGFFAPFPNMWFAPAGITGRVGRIVSAGETSVMYLLYIVAAICLWRERRRLTMWFLFLVAGLSLIALGLVVANAGALYRLRYVFWVMLIIVAAQGMSSLFSSDWCKLRLRITSILE